MNDEGKIKVLLVKPMEKPKVVEIGNDLKSMQNIVGGYIEEILPYEDDVAIVANEEGKMMGLELNRAIYNEKGHLQDIIAGDFFICYAPIESGEFLSLPDELLKKYEKKFKTPEKFYNSPQGIKVIPVKSKSNEMER